MKRLPIVVALLGACILGSSCGLDPNFNYGAVRGVDYEGVLHYLSGPVPNTGSPTIGYWKLSVDTSTWSGPGRTR